jgi:hypothetical protein
VTDPRRARTAVAVVFAMNGLCFATMASRVPDLRSSLELSNGTLGLLLLAIALGSMLGMPASGHLIERFGADAVVRLGAAMVLLGLVAAGIGAASGSVPLAAAGLCVDGFGTGTWDVGMNVEGAVVERLLGRSILPRFHAGWSLGTFTGAGLGAVAAAVNLPLPVHFLVVPATAVGVAVVRSRGFPSGSPTEAARTASSGSAWLEPRTLAIGLMVLGFALFVASATVGRLGGPPALDRFGRTRVLLASSLAALAGIRVVVWSGLAAGSNTHLTLPTTPYV